MTARRGATQRRTFGAVERLASGRWRARYTGPDRRMRPAPVTFETKADADAWLVTVRADMLRGQWSPPERARVIFADYVATWLRQKAPHLRPRTQDLYARAAARWLLAPVGTGRHGVELGPLPLPAISAALVREWFAAVTIEAHTSATSRGNAAARIAPARAWALDQGLDVKTTGRMSPAVLAAWRAAGSPTSTTATPPRPRAGATAAAQAYRLLHAILAEAANDGLIATNPARIPGAGHVAHPERIPLSPAEVATLANAVANRLRAEVLVSAWSGLRPGETFALRRADVDFATGQLTVRRTLIEMPGQPVSYGPPKTAAGARAVAMPASVLDGLRGHRACYTDPGAQALIFTTTTGRPVTAQALRIARQTMGRPDLTWHHLRHTGATLAAQAGATPAELQRRIGHSTARAANLYQHASLTRDHLIATALDDLAVKYGERRVRIESTPAN